MVIISEVGRGYVNAKQKHKTNPGEARLSKNFFFGTAEDGTYNRAELRKYTKRAWLSRPSNHNGMFIYELRKDDGTRVRFYKSNGVMYTWATNPATALTSVSSGFSIGTTDFVDACQGFDRIYFADSAGGGSNWAYSTTSNFFLLTPTARPTDAMVLAEAGAVNGFGTGEFEYNYTLYSSAEGWETRAKTASTSITKANANLGVQFSDPTDPGLTGIYNRYRLYRRLRGENAWYLIATIDPASGFPYQDNTLEDDLTDAALSEIHDNETGLDDYEVPPVFTSTAFYRDRVWGACQDTLWWSKVQLPFLFRTNEIARKQIGDDGDPIIAVRAVNESLVVFKKHSIWILNGDAEEENFIFFPVTRSVGLIGKLAIALCPGGCIFVGSDKRVYYFDLSSVQVISGLVELDANWSRADYFCAGYDPESRHVYITFPAAGSSNNDTTYAVAIDGFTWSPLEFLNIYPSYYGICFNSAEEQKLYFTDQQGYAYETQTAATGDGVNSGTSSGRIDVGTSTTVFTIQGAVLLNTNDKLKGLTVSIETADGIIEHKVIDTNTATQITATSAFSIIPQHNMKVWIGGMNALLWFAPLKLDKRKARVDNLYFSQNEQTREWKMGATVNAESSRTRFKIRTPSELEIIPVNRRCISISPFIETFDTELEMDFGAIEFEPVSVK